MKETNFPSRQDFWKALVREMQTSPLSQGEFAKVKNVSKSSLVRWAKRMAEPLPVRRRRACKGRNDFLIVEPQTGSDSRVQTEAVKIVFPSGAVIHFAEPPDAEWFSLMMKLIA